MKTKRLLIALVLFAILLLAACSSQLRIGALRSESKSVELGDAKSVRVTINMGAGTLTLTGGAEKLMEADFKYNVARLKPEVEYSDGTLTVKQPEVNGFPSLVGIGEFQNEWGVRLYNGVPMDLSVVMGGGSSDLSLAGLSLTALDVNLGAGIYTIDLTGDWPRNLDVTIEAGAATVTLRLPSEIGTRVKVESGPHTVEATGLTKDGEFYTNAAYGLSDVTMQIDLTEGIGMINLEVEEAGAASD